MITYQTSDAALAVTLATCGVPFLRTPKGIVPLYNFYDASLLRKYGFKNMSLETAALAAWKAGKRGYIHYNFERTDLCERILKVWTSHGKAIAQADVSELSCAASPEVIATICCQFASNRKWLTETAWRKTVPMIAFDVESHRESESVTVGSFKAVSCNASPELRRSLGMTA